MPNASDTVSNVATSVADAVTKGTWGAGGGTRVFGPGDASAIATYLGQISQGDYREAFSTALSYSAGIAAGELVGGFLIGLGVGGPVGAVVGAIAGAAIGLGLDQTEVVKDIGRAWYDKIRESNQELPPWDEASKHLPDINKQREKLKENLPYSDGVWNPALGQWEDFKKLTKPNEFPDFSKPAQAVSPIIIDLDGDGVETVSRGQGTYFDLNNNRFAEKTGWVGADDALLVLDRNGNGLIDNGGELFGSETLLANGKKAANGFDALAELDSNKDGKLDSQDEAWSKLKLWQDKNGDGVSSVDELKTLAESGLTSLNLQYATQNKTDAAGNQHKQTSQAQWQDGRITDAVDVWFAVNHADSKDLGAKALPDELLKLPNARGFGDLPDLRQAMLNDKELRGLVEQYVGAATSEARKALLLPLIYQWAGVTNIDPNSRDPSKVYGHVMDARQLVALEKLVGEGYIGTWCWGERDPNPHGVAAPLLKAEFDKFSSYVEAQLQAQTEFKSVMDQVSLRYDADRKQFGIDWSAVNVFIQDLATQGKLKQLDRFNEMLGHLGNYTSSLRDSYRENLNALMPSLPFDASEVLQHKVLLGDGADDTLNGGSGDDKILVLVAMMF
ncbi:hypothetical protein [Chromobacterium vaccinii]|uniref:hypothetical protein n=1 Tax=Chromobacterium vaccinii TaxID=1108595 RepID=UPI0011C06464|nr:hypothetical protein [Chromobacterium vaccinii]